MHLGSITMQPLKQAVTMTFQTVTYWLIVNQLFQEILAVDKGFELLFSTQKTTFYGIKVNFTTQRPKWLNGTYVSNFLFA